MCAHRFVVGVALTTRVAWMVKEKNVDPSSLVVVTFTNKAAKEMKQRLEKPSLLGQEQSSLLSVGTFHALCAQLLRLHVDLTSLEDNFVVADVDKSKQLVKMVIKDLQPTLSLSSQRRKPGKKDPPLLSPRILILVFTVDRYILPVYQQSKK